MAKKTAKKSKARKAGRTSGRPTTSSARKARSRTTAGKKKAASTRKKTRKPAGTRRSAAAARSASTSKAKRTSRTKTSGRTARKGTSKRKATKKRTTAATRKGAVTRKTAPGRKATQPRTRATATARKGGRGHERTLAQTPETGRSVKGPTNPMPTRRSTGTAAGAGNTRHVPGLDRERRRLRELEEELQTPPSSLDMDRMASAARTGRAEMEEDLREHTETSPALTGGDVDANWQDAYATGDESPGGDNPTPDQDRVDDIGKALGVTYEDNEELKASDKIAERDRHRWELDPASSEDYRTRDKDIDEE
jgi:hypothetical protein